jgi:hypothetical protein
VLGRVGGYLLLESAQFHRELDLNSLSRLMNVGFKTAQSCIGT